MRSLPDVSVAIMVVSALVCVALLTESRLSRRATLLWVCGVGAAVVCVNQWARLALSVVASTQALMATVVAPYLLLFWWLSALRNGRVAFTTCMVFALAFASAIMGYIVDSWLLSSCDLPFGLVRFVLRTAASLLLVVAAARFRRSYLAVQRSMDRGWWGNAAIAALFCVLQVLVDTSIDRSAPWPGYLPQVVTLWILVPLVFGAILVSLADQLSLADAASRELDALAAHDALNERVQLSQEAEAALAEEQDELVLRLEELDRLLAAGEVERARALVASADAALAQTSVQRWCTDPVYDAVIVAYLRRAEAMGTKLEVKLDLPEGLGLDATEFSCVLGNALENALVALAKVPEGERCLELRCVCWPQFMLLVGNACVGAVEFGDDGLPVAHAEGHGLGTRSIAAYCAKYGASLDYEQVGQWFTVTIVQELNETA